SIYLPILRGYVPEGLQVFDMADPNLIVGKRDVTTVPTQALYLMNNPLVLKQAEALASRVMSRQDLDQQGKITYAYRLALGRSPSDTEKANVAKFLNQYRQALSAAGHEPRAFLAAWTSFCQTLFATA